MMNKRAIIILLLLSIYPLNEIYIFFDDKSVYCYPLNKHLHENLQWYVKDICNCLTSILVVGCWWAKEKKGYFKNALFSFVLFYIIDLISYLLYHREAGFLYTTTYIVIFIYIVINIKKCDK